MTKTGYDIFISYRREGGKNYARTLKPELEKRGFKVFLDFDELKDGVFDKRIMDAISESPIFLVILSQGALDRCINEEDWVRQEILFANKSNRHIVPVEVDKTFRGFPSNIPNEIKTVLGQHQFSQIDTETLLQESIDKLVKDRIIPHIHHEEKETGVEIHIDTDEDCNLFRFKTFIKELKAGEDNIVYLSPGKYKLEFVSIDFPEIKESQVYSIASDVSCDILEVSLSERIEAEQARRKAEEDRLKREELEKLEVYLIEEDGKYGYADIEGNVIIPCKWGKAKKDFSEGLAAVAQDNGKWGFIDKTGELVIPCKWANTGSFKDELAPVQDENDKWGFIDKTGKIIIPCKWIQAKNFNEGLACVVIENDKEEVKAGFINKAGEVVIPCKWDGAEDFEGGLARVSDGMKQGWIDKTGKVITPTDCLYTDVFIEGMTSFKGENEKWGLIDKIGTIISPCIWEEVRRSSEGLTAVAQKNGKWGFVDKTGKLVIPCKWADTHPFKDELAPVQNENGKWGFINTSGEEVIPLRWKSADKFSEGLACVQDENEKWGYIDRTGKEVIPIIWRSVGSFSEGLAYVQDENEKWGFIDKTGEIVIPCKWNNVHDFKEGRASIQDENEKWGFIDKTGNVVISCKFWYADYFYNDGIALVLIDYRKRLFINKLGTILKMNFLDFYGE